MPKRRRSGNREPVRTSEKKKNRKQKGKEKAEELTELDKWLMEAQTTISVSPGETFADEEISPVPSFVTNKGLFNDYYLVHRIVPDFFEKEDNDEINSAFETYQKYVETLKPATIRIFQKNESECRAGIITTILGDVLGHGKYIHHEYTLGNSGNERAGVLLHCLSLLGEKMHQLKDTKRKNNALRLIDTFVNGLYGLGIDETDYLNRYFDFIAT